MADRQATKRNKQLGVRALMGLGAFAAGAVAWAVGTGRYGDRLAGLLKKLPATTGGAGAGDGATSSVVSRPAGATFGEQSGDAAGGHVPTDLLADREVTAATRAPDAFRPDPTAVPTAGEREGLRPATGPAPTMVADRGSGSSDAAGAA